MTVKTNWIKQHADTMVILGSVVGAVLWMNGKFYDIETRFAAIEIRLVRIETILFMKGILPSEYTVNKEVEQK